MGWLWELSRFSKSDGWCLRAGKGTAPACWHQGELPGGRVDAPFMRRRKKQHKPRPGKGWLSPLAHRAPGGRLAPASVGRASSESVWGSHWRLEAPVRGKALHPAVSCSLHDRDEPTHPTTVQSLIGHSCRQKPGLKLSASRI